MSVNIPGMTMSGFIDALGSRTPAPGGGSALKGEISPPIIGGGAVAALLGASGAGLLLWAAEYAKWEEGTPDPRPRLKEISAGLLALAQEDVEVFTAFKTAQAKKSSDPAGYGRAVDAITEVPVRFCESAVEALETVPVILRSAPRSYACDIAIGVAGLEACADGGRLLAGVNLGFAGGPGRDSMSARLSSAGARLEKIRNSNSPLLMRALPGK